ncbi:MAG TPA: hypothetical protein VGX69_12025 [Solirubrobacteraceae bacterium]|nr:hypothetical protein [Solirubrobacteraceae bacterium]
MTRRARERFRIYTDDELLVDPDTWLSALSAPYRADSRRRRIAGAALLIGAVGSVAGVAGARLLATTRHPRAGRGAIARTPPPAIVASSVLSRHAVEAVPAARGGAAGAPARVERPPASAVRRAASFSRTHATLGPASRRLRSSDGPILRRRAAIDVSVADTHGPSASSVEATAVASGSLPKSTREGGEFGFER